MVDVIEISGSEEDDNVRKKPVVVSRRRRTSSLSAISSTSHRIQSYRGDINGVESDVDLHSHNRRPKPGTERARVRRIIQSSSSSSEGEGRVFNQAGGTPRIRHPGVADVIEISDSDDEVEDVLGGREPPFGRCRPPPPPPQALPPFDEEHEQTETDDDGLLILNEPKSARRPLPRLHRPQTARTTARVLRIGLATRERKKKMLMASCKHSPLFRP
ncbi:hypothetical protein BGW80DRAFT_736681 [Lactifluus volemus]|nr:hypothetical protein BGW80DRAFT_736681 [Lactifluus volemus]